MADRDAWQSLTRYSIIVLIVILIVWIISVITGGSSTPGPQPVGDSLEAPVVKP
jgi:hypothetical protein